ncbi:MAG: hypothetical protein EOO68_37920 [Moraxellaceae bacterium]|nr:MAG: hypothetical protein EOO68_37920 [Moraxellaceae bacterium]
MQLHFYEPLASFRAGNTKPGFGKKLLEALGHGAAMLQSLLLGLVTIRPLLLLATFAIMFWRRKTQRKIVHAS